MRMNVLTKKIIKPVVLFLVSSGYFSIVLADNHLCGDGQVIEGDSGDNIIRVRPQGLVEVDYSALQWAVDNVSSGGTVELCEGTFNLGLGYEKRSITVSKGIHIEGKKIADEWKTVIKGGGSLHGIIPDPEIGPILIASESDFNPVSIKNVWMRDWTSEAVYITGCNGFSLEDSKLSHPITGLPLLTTYFIHAVFSLNSTSRGEFILRNNHVDLTWLSGTKPHDTQFTGIYGPPGPAYTKIDISNNTIITNDEAIELIANDAGEPSQIFIENNDISVDFDVDGIWPNHYALLFASNKNVDFVMIRNNRINMKNSMNLSVPVLDAMGAIHFTGDNFYLADNEVHFNDFDGTGIRIGNLGNLGIIDLGTSMNNSLIENNIFTGSLTGPAIEFTSYWLNSSQNNIFRLGSSFAELDTDTTIQNISTRACNNTFEGDTGRVVGNINRRCPRFWWR